MVLEMLMLEWEIAELAGEYEDMQRYSVHTLYGTSTVLEYLPAVLDIS